MKKLMPAVAFATLMSTAAFAQTAPPAATPAPSATERPMTPMAPSNTMSPSMMDTKPLLLTDAEAKAWVDKTVVSSDGQKLGEVAAFARDASGKVTEMHADIGGFLGIGESRIRLMPNQFKLNTDQVVLNLTAEQAKALPKIAKK
jgi:hypothetical protein